MALIASMDYPNNLIYLSADSVGVDLDTVLVYKEARALRRLVEAHRKFDRMIVASGNVEKIAGVSYTAISVQLLNGCRIVPYDTDQELKLVRDTFTDDGYAGVDCFDRSSLSNSVDIDVDFPEIEIRVVTTGGSALTTAENTKLMSLPDTDDIMGSTIEGSLDLAETLRLILAATTGSSDGAGTGTFEYKSVDGATTRIRSTFDVDGNRQITLLDAS